MKKKLFIICSVLLVILVIGGICIYSAFRDEKVEKFSLNDEPYYLQAIQDFPSDKVLGEILTAKDAKEKALDEWLEKFGEKVKNDKPYKVFYDEKNEIWLVKGSLPRSIFSSVKGSVPNILIRKSDGKVLAIWYG